MPDTSAIVLTYRRPHNLRLIVARLLEQPWIDDITVWNNDPDTPLDVDVLPDSPRVAWVDSKTNLYTWGRFKATDFTLHDTIATVDDDILTHNWEEVYDAHQANPDVITTAMAPGHVRYHKSTVWGDAHEVLLGWGSIFDRRWIEPAFAPYLIKHGVDEVLHRKADRLFAILLNRHHHVIQADFDELPGAREGGALWLRQDHTTLTREARKRALELLEARAAVA